MDELLAEIDNYGTVKGDSKNLGRFATSVSVFVSDMEDNGCPVQEVREAPLFMSKLEPKDNADFKREMQRQKKEENVANLVDWLHQEAAFRSRGKKEIEGSMSYKEHGGRRTDHHANDFLIHNSLILDL